MFTRMNSVKRLLVVGALLFALAHATAARTYKEVSELGKIFESNGVAGTFVLFDREADAMFVWNEARAKERFIPASTFKIAKFAHRSRGRRGEGR